MHQDTAATAADWRLYQLRKHLTLFETAALMHRQDPARLKSAMREEYMRTLHAAVSAGLDGCRPPDALELPMHRSVRDFLASLRTATGESADDAKITTDDAMSIAAALGKSWPPELPTAGAHQVARFSQGGTAAAPEPLTPLKRAAIIERLGRRYPALESALNRGEEWAKACRVPDRHGWYYLERIEAECRARYGGAAPAPAADMSPAAQLRRISP